MLRNNIIFLFYQYDYLTFIFKQTMKPTSKKQIKSPDKKQPIKEIKVIIYS